MSNRFELIEPEIVGACYKVVYRRFLYSAYNSKGRYLSPTLVFRKVKINGFSGLAEDPSGMILL